MKRAYSICRASTLFLVIAAQFATMLGGVSQCLATDETIAPINSKSEAVAPENTLTTRFFLANRKNLTPKYSQGMSGGDPRTAVPAPSSVFKRAIVQLGADEIAAEVQLRKVMAEILECSTNAIKDGHFLVSTATGKMASYNDRNHLLLVRATAAELDRIEDLLYPLNRTRRQFEFDIQWLAVDPREADAALHPGANHKDNGGEMSAAVTMNADKAQAMIETLSRQKSCQRLAEPRLTARENRECALALSEHGVRLSLLPSLVNEAKTTVNLDVQLELAWNSGESARSQSSRAQMKPGEVMVLSQHFTAKNAAGKPPKPDVYFFISTKLLPPTTIPSWAMAKPGRQADPVAK